MGNLRKDHVAERFVIVNESPKKSLKKSSKTQKQDTAFSRITGFTRMKLVENTNSEKNAARCFFIFSSWFLKYENKQKVRGSILFLFYVAIKKSIFSFSFGEVGKSYKKEKLTRCSHLSEKQLSLILFLGKEEGSLENEAVERNTGHESWDRILSTIVPLCLVDKKFQRVLCIFVYCLFFFRFI